MQGYEAVNLPFANRLGMQKILFGGKRRTESIVPVGPFNFHIKQTQREKRGGNQLESDIWNLSMVFDQLIILRNMRMNYLFLA